MVFETVETVLPKNFVPKTDPSKPTPAPFVTEPEPVPTPPVTPEKPTPPSSPESRADAASVSSPRMSSSSRDNDETESPADAVGKKKKKKSMISRLRRSVRRLRERSRSRSKSRGSINDTFSIEVGDENEHFEIGILEGADEPQAVVPLPKEAELDDASVTSKGTKGSKASKARPGKPPTTIPPPKEAELDDVSVTSKDTKGSKASKARPGKPSTRRCCPPLVENVYTFDDMSVASKRRYNDNAATTDDGFALVPVNNDTIAVSERPSGIRADYETSSPKAQPEENVLTQTAKEQNLEKKKWVKTVSLSIAGYTTSFQISDPMANLSETVNEALKVVSGDSALDADAKALDDIGGKVDEERDYDENPTKLFMLLQERSWGLALAQLKKSPEECKVLVYRKVSPEKDETKLRWKLSPLHLSIVLGAPPEVIFEIIKAHPSAARKTDERGSLPVHLASSRLDVDPEGEKVVLQLFGVYPDSIDAQDRKGRTPPELAKLARMRKYTELKRRSNAFSDQEEGGVELTIDSTQEKKVDEDSDDDEHEESPEPNGGAIKVNESYSKDEPNEDDSSVKSNKSAKWSPFPLKK